MRVYEAVAETLRDAGVEVMFGLLALALSEEQDSDRIDPRQLSIVLNDLLPANRTLVLDSGVSETYPFAYIDVPDPDGFVFVQSFMSVGFGLGNAGGCCGCSTRSIDGC